MAGIPAQPSFADLLTQALDRPLPLHLNSPSSPSYVFSPLKQDLLYYIDVAFEKAFWFGAFVHRDSIEAAVHRMYGSNARSAAHRDEIALMYAIVALGESFVDTTPGDGNMRG
ncbi:Gypsy retrotransposon integrase-like protein 1 [Vermiconidia calcicola]|uniref:Gypsy retrotransposon integrase-like protein 1 n=1 Tax=Vermiconidia calcicola TaxID=1690605 RepID=A0ACC3MAD4_9PEZI|nr:Gypsy retrotransposon integrase-like protein 1 [Vermiconidia calcicola]